MSKYHTPLCLAAALVTLVATGMADAKRPMSNGFPCAQQTSKRIENRSGNFEIVSRPVMDAPIVQPISLRVGQTVQIDRALLSQIAAPGVESVR